MTSKIVSSSVVDLIRHKIMDKIVNKKNISNYLSSNSYILSIYFNFGTSLFFFISCCIFYNVFTTEIILCNNSHQEGAAGKSKLPFLYVNYCLSYPKLSNGQDKFALFYKWVPWITSACCFIIYTPKILINKLSCNYIALHLMKINYLSNNYYSNDEEKRKKNNKRNNSDDDDDVDRTFDCDYDKYCNKSIKNLITELINLRWNRCSDIYWKCLFTHTYALAVNFFLILLLDFLLQGRFLFYVQKTFPFQRNITHFSDTMSQTFYPFSECNINQNTIIQGRSEYIVCHLTLMEYYEKIFFIIWLYLFILPIFTFVYILHIFLLFRNNYNSFLEHLLKRHLSYNLFFVCKKLMNQKKKKDDHIA